MNDTRLGALERRWKETGSLDDEAAYLLVCVRVGTFARSAWSWPRTAGMRGEETRRREPSDGHTHLRSRELLGHARLDTTAIGVEVEREDLRRVIEVLDHTRRSQ
ncbi:MAG: hypothetical protein KF878_26165 [Planctomycetes bacterium]|nr:hypothetical protein [Planctomycetota bacterium]